jgi:hypothetical protein
MKSLEQIRYVKNTQNDLPIIWKEKQFNKKAASKANEMTEEDWKSSLCLDSLEFKLPRHS